MAAAAACNRSARRGYPNRPHSRTASPGESPASPAGVGHRVSHCSQTGATRATGVCWSITSLTTTPQGVTPGRRHGRSLACSSYQAVTAAANVSIISGSQSPTRGWTAAYDQAVSSVLRPVGPERPGVYWLRRSVIVVVLLAVIAVVVHVLAGGSSGPKAGAAPDGTAGSPTPSTSTTSSTPECTAAALSVTLTTDKQQYASGESATFTGTFRNDSDTPCRLRSTVKSRVWTVTSGPATTWTTSGCSLTGKPKKATLTATRKATVSISWDAHRNDASCTTGPVASPGTYVLRGTFDGVTAKPAVFHVVS